jgi:hypothetical protein
MKHIVASLVAGVVLLAGCSRVSPEAGLESLASWSNLGGKVNNVDDEIIMALAFNASGNPVVITIGSLVTSSSYKAYVKQWVGDSWSVLGRVINNNPNQTASSPNLVVDKLGRPVVAWAETNARGANNIYVKRWNGQGWVLLGGRLNVEDAYVPILTIDNQNRPVVAWTEESPSGLPFGTGNLSVKRWENDSSWVQLGGILDNVETNTVEEMSIVVDKVGRPIVAWREINVGTFFESDVCVKRWNGLSWVSLGGTLGGGDASSIVLSSTGRLFIAVRDAGNKVVVKRWDGNGVWTSLLGPRAARLGSGFFLTSDGDTPILAWQLIYGIAYVKRWNGVDKWIDIGSQPVLTDSMITDFEMSPAGVLSLAYHYQPTDPNHFDEWGAYVKSYQ